MGATSSTQNPIKTQYMVMLMKDSELRELAEKHYNMIVKNATKSKPANNKLMREKAIAKRELMSLLDKCNELNVISRKLNQPRKVYIGEIAQGCLQWGIEVTMRRLETWLPRNWTGLVKELQCEIKIAYDKFVNLMKKYSESIETSEEKHEADIFKAIIASEIQDYVKCGINISLRIFYLEFTSLDWVRKIKLHMEMLVFELEGLTIREYDDMGSLLNNVRLYKQCMMDFGDCFLSPKKELKSEAYSELLINGGKPFSILIERKIYWMGLEGKFDSIGYKRQLQVCRGISKDYGGKITSNIQFVDFIFGDGSKTFFYPLLSVRVGGPVMLTKRIIP